MKKYLYLLMGMLCTLFSCTDSKEIDIVQQNDVTFNVNIANVYESWGISDFQNYLGKNKSKSVGIFTFIYDEKGQLARKVNTSAKTFQTATQNIDKLKAGDYEVVTLVTMINDDDKESSVWDIVDESMLNTLMVKFKEKISMAYWHEAIGLANLSVKIGENTNLIITPQPVGSIIDVEYENFGLSHYNYFGFESRNNAKGLRLAPNLPESDRYYVEEYNPSNEWGAIGGFYNKGEDLIDNDVKTFYTFQTGHRPYLFGVAQNMSSDNTKFDFSIKGEFNFENGKMYKAFAYYVGAPDYLKTFIGSTSEFNTWYNNLDKTINPIFAEPCTAWGSSVSYVKSYMKGYEIEYDIQEGEGNYFMIFTGQYSERWIEYDFETATSGLETVFIPIYEDYATESAIESQLIQFGYTYEGYIEGDADYLGYQLYSKEDTLVGVFVGLIDSNGDKYTTIQFVSGENDETRGCPGSRILGKVERLKKSPIQNRFSKVMSRYINH